MMQLQHIANTCHVYCRLVNLGISKPMAKKICKYYEKTLLHNLLYVKGKRKMVSYSRLKEIATISQRIKELKIELKGLELSRQKLVYSDKLSWVLDHMPKQSTEKGRI